MNCPNCGSYGTCNCTWSEKSRAVDIIRRRERDARRKSGRPTVIEQEAMRDLPCVLCGNEACEGDCLKRR